LPSVLKVSVIVPVYNPGENIDDCIDSVLNQSLPASDYEVVFVDDGSTDETPARLDVLAAEHDNVRVEHIPNSGWPGRPRNIGIDMARGEYVYFVDNDDWIDREALERMHAKAVADGTDVLVGKVVGHGKFVPRGMFRRNRDDLTLATNTLLGLLTPHKLFRKAFLDEHGIRFPEGRRRLEDHIFVMHAYFHAGRVSVLADHPIYHWMKREGESNASYRPFEPEGYYENVREVLDLIEEHTEPGPDRERLISHWYRGKMLKRMGAPHFLRRPADYRRELYDEVRKLALERYDEGANAWLPLNYRVRAHILRESPYESIETLADWETDLKADVQALKTSRRDGGFAVRYEARLEGKGGPLVFRRTQDGRVFWQPPAKLADEVPERWLEATDELFKSHVQVLVRSTVTGAEYVVPGEDKVRLIPVGDGDDGAVTPVLEGLAKVDRTDAAAGAPPPPADYQVLGVVNIGGFSDTTRMRRAGKSVPMKVTIGEDEGAPAEIGPERASAASFKRRLALRLPRLARAVIRARGRNRASAPG
jgi:glycosyltransferase involved in cell wall biosynthesis